jgi:hypothetical protein
MATLNSVNAQLYQNVPRDMVDVTEQHGRMRILKDEITLTAELTAADVIRVGAPLPKGAMVVAARLQSSQLGSVGGAGELDLGWQASADAAEAADADGFLAAVEVGSAAANAAMEEQATTPAGYLKKFAGEVQVVITANETTDAGIGDKITVALFYVVD